jgi:uncharacterized protein YrrD
MTEGLMRRVSEYVGKSIVAADSGEKVGTVADVLVDADAGRIVGVIVGGGLLTSEQVLPYADVQVMGGDAVIVTSRERVIGAREWRETGSDAARAKTYKNKRVITTGGRELGIVKDVYVNENTGVVEAYDVAGPAFTRLLQRRSILSQSADVTVGPDALIVSEGAAGEFEHPTPTNSPHESVQ